VSSRLLLGLMSVVIFGALVLAACSAPTPTAQLSEDEAIDAVQGYLDGRTYLMNGVSFDCINLYQEEALFWKGFESEDRWDIYVLVQIPRGIDPAGGPAIHSWTIYGDSQKIFSYQAC
jgi:hypothetical protein